LTLHEFQFTKKEMRIYFFLKNQRTHSSFINQCIQNREKDSNFENKESVLSKEHVSEWNLLGVSDG